MPRRARTLVVGLVEPALIAGCYLLCVLAFGGTLQRPDWVLAFLSMLLAFPAGRRAGVEHRGFFDLLFSWVALVGLLALCAWATDAFGLFRIDVLAAWVALTPFVLWAAHLGVRWWVSRDHAAAAAVGEAARVVVVGSGTLADKTVRALTMDIQHPMKVLGTFDDREVPRSGDGGGATRLGPLAELRPYVRTHQVSKIFITLPLNTQPRIQTLLESVGDTNAELYYVPDIFGVSIIQGRLTHLGGLPVVGLLETPFTGMNAVVKRASDVVLSLIGLVATAPILAACAIAVRRSSEGPVLFKQKRHGMGGKEITVYKFRTMYVHEPATTVVQASRGDARITPVGAFLRRTSLDELPQLFNVLQGRMSMVGPRPHALSHNEKFRSLIDAYMVRHKVRPGITGWAQIHGHRGPTETVDKMRTRVEYDIEYLRNWSLGLDIKILVKTVLLVLKDRNAF